jgi:hypothetical protein
MEARGEGGRPARWTVYAENLVMIQRAGDLTQVAVAEPLGVGQTVVSRLERSDMLLSTLASCRGSW